MSTGSKIPSRKARITAEVTRRLSGEIPRNCLGCAYLYVIPRHEAYLNWVGCAQDVAPPPLPYNEPQNCQAPWYKGAGYTYLNQAGKISTAQFPRIGLMAKKNAQKYFEFGDHYPRLRPEVDPANS
jgi:hypothetical protein